MKRFLILNRINGSNPTFWQRAHHSVEAKQACSPVLLFTLQLAFFPLPVMLEGIQV